MTTKDRPRKKDWKREYCKSKESGRYRDDIRSGSFMILGGINIEDKEYYSDLKGRLYHDYMIKISEPDIVAQFLEKRKDPQNKSDLFRINMKKPVSCFELKSGYMEIIDSAERELLHNDGLLCA